MLERSLSKAAEVKKAKGECSHKDDLIDLLTKTKDIDSVKRLEAKTASIRKYVISDLQGM